MSKSEFKEPTASTQYSKRIILALRQIMQQLDNHSRKLNKDYGLTIPQIICLYEIYEKGALTLSVLSKNIHLSMSTLVGVIDRLEKKSFVKRTRGTGDRRITFIDITDNGKEFVSKSPQLLHNRLDNQLKTLPVNDQIIIANSLDLLVDMLGKK